MKTSSLTRKEFIDAFQEYIVAGLYLSQHWTAVQNHEDLEEFSRMLDSLDFPFEGDFDGYVSSMVSLYHKVLINEYRTV